MLYTNLKNVPAISTQELLLHLKSNHVTIKIVTQSGQHYCGIVLNIGKPTHSENTVTLQIVTDKNQITTKVLHITVAKIESVLLFEEAETILSLGKIIKSNSYEISSKLELQRSLQQFSTNILNATTLEVGVPEIEIPENGFSINRIIKILVVIQDVILSVLNDDDAKISWKQDISSLAFTENNDFEVQVKDKKLSLFFPFSDITVPEIKPELLKEKLYKIL